MNKNYRLKFLFIIPLFFFFLLVKIDFVSASSNPWMNTNNNPCPAGCELVAVPPLSAVCMSSFNTSTPCSAAAMENQQNLEALRIEKEKYFCHWTDLEIDGGNTYGGCEDNEQKKDNFYCSEEKPASIQTTNGVKTHVCCCRERVSVDRPDLNPLGNLKIKIPGLDELADKYPVKCEENSDQETCQIPWIAVYIYAIYNYFLAIGGVVAAIALMIGGVIWLISAGNASRISEAKSWISGSLTGILILLTSYILLYQINPDMVNLAYVELRTIEPIYLETEITEAVDYNGEGLYPPSQWISLSSHPNIKNDASGRTNPELAQAIIKAADCMKGYGYKIKVISLSRTVERQKELYDKNYTHEPNACGKLISDKAEVCCPYPTESKLCPHTSGSAVDMWGLDASGNKSKQAQNQLQDCMFLAGTCLLKSECWHFELPTLSTGYCSQTKNLSKCGELQ